MYIWRFCTKPPNLIHQYTNINFCRQTTPYCIIINTSQEYMFINFSIYSNCTLLSDLSQQRK